LGTWGGEGGGRKKIGGFAMERKKEKATPVREGKDFRHYGRGKKNEAS